MAAVTWHVVHAVDGQEQTSTEQPASAACLHYGGTNHGTVLLSIAREEVSIEFGRHSLR